MRRLSDVWYVRLPDGRVFRASSTRGVRRHVKAGLIPANSLVRRSAKMEWVALRRRREFADLLLPRETNGAKLVPSAAEKTKRLKKHPDEIGVAAHLDPDRLHTVGVRGLVQEALAALDCAIVRAKLGVACLVGLFGAVGALAAGDFAAGLTFPQAAVPWAAFTAGLLIVLAVGHAVLMQMTFLELSHLRPARRAEITVGLVRNIFRVALAYLAVAGSAVLCFAVLRWFPAWLQHESGWKVPALAHDALVVVALILEVSLWPVLASALLLGAVLVVEDCPLRAALRQWWDVLNRHYARFFFFEALTAATGAVGVLPFAVPLAVAAVGRAALPAATDALVLLGGLAAAPLIAYLAVANVFIYLYLRYERAE
jgi:hypothetical protein